MALSAPPKCLMADQPPVGRIPEFEFCAVRVEPANGHAEPPQSSQARQGAGW